MSNERIDLTQFEGKGISPLMVIPGTYTIAEDNNRIYEDEGYNYPEDDKNRYGWIVGHIDSHYETDDPEYGIVQSERQEAMAKLFAMAPDLIAELKKCYEELDRPKVTIDDWDKEGPCVTVYLEGKEYVGILREYDASE
jgi:hypothetical protein